MTRPEKPRTGTACLYPGPDDRPCPPCVWYVQIIRPILKGFSMYLMSICITRHLRFGCVHPYVPPEDAEVVTKGSAVAGPSDGKPKPSGVATDTCTI